MIYGKCESCRRNGWFPKKRKIKIPFTGEAMSQKTMCLKCASALKVLAKITFK